MDIYCAFKRSFSSTPRRKVTILLPKKAFSKLTQSSIVVTVLAAVYGEPSKQPIEESDPTGPTNPYGESKLAFERALNWYSRAYGLRYVSLRYFNAAGANEHCGERASSRDSPDSSGVAGCGLTTTTRPTTAMTPTCDGTCIRDYIHVVDLARAHILAFDQLEKRGGIYNLGCGGDGYTVNQVIECAREVAGRDIAVKVGLRRAGDPAVLIARSNLIKQSWDGRPHFRTWKTLSAPHSHG
jgi:UDP-glucose 4-epimerase